jgi:guanylate kinase
MGQFIIISAPSGTGKNAIIRDLLKIFSSSTRFITTSTRDPRPMERNGVDYHFVSLDQFESMRQKNEFLECNNYAGNWYGSERKRLEEGLARYEYVFSTLDVNGKRSLDVLNFPHTAIFLLPDNLEILDDRIRNRGGEAENDIEKRISIAHDEIAEAKNYDFQVVNKEGKMAETVDQIVAYLQKYPNH